jgi:hypothetical protein
MPAGPLNVHVDLDVIDAAALPGLRYPAPLTRDTFGDPFSHDQQARQKLGRPAATRALTQRRRQVHAAASGTR